MLPNMIPCCRRDLLTLAIDVTVNVCGMSGSLTSMKNKRQALNAACVFVRCFIRERRASTACWLRDCYGKIQAISPNYPNAWPRSQLPSASRPNGYKRLAMTLNRPLTQEQSQTAPGGSPLCSIGPRPCESICPSHGQQISSDCNPLSASCALSCCWPPLRLPPSVLRTAPKPSGRLYEQLP